MHLFPPACWSEVLSYYHSIAQLVLYQCMQLYVSMCEHAHHHACIFSSQTPVANKEGLISVLWDGHVIQQRPSCTVFTMPSYLNSSPMRQDEWLSWRHRVPTPLFVRSLKVNAPAHRSKEISKNCAEVAKQLNSSYTTFKLWLYFHVLFSHPSFSTSQV